MYTYYSDPGHAWLEVKRAELVKLGIADQISGFSYQRGDYVYLEEDCDAPIFVRAKEAIGEKAEYQEAYQDSTPIRDYEPYRGGNHVSK